MPEDISSIHKHVMLSTKVVNQVVLWHCHLGHIPYSALVAMHNSGIYPDIVFMAAELHATTLTLGRACSLGKLSKKPYKLSRSTRATAYLE